MYPYTSHLSLPGPRNTVTHWLERREGDGVETGRVRRVGCRSETGTERWQSVRNWRSSDSHVSYRRVKWESFQLDRTLPGSLPEYTCKVTGGLREGILIRHLGNPSRKVPKPIDHTLDLSTSPISTRLGEPGWLKSGTTPYTGLLLVSPRGFWYDKSYHRWFVYADDRFNDLLKVSFTYDVKLLCHVSFFSLFIDRVICINRQRKRKKKNLHQYPLKFNEYTE